MTLLKSKSKINLDSCTWPTHRTAVEKTHGIREREENHHRLRDSRLQGLLLYSIHKELDIRAEKESAMNIVDWDRTYFMTKYYVR